MRTGLQALNLGDEGVLRHSVTSSSGLFSTLTRLDPLEAEFHIFSCWGGITVCTVTMWGPTSS